MLKTNYKHRLTGLPIVVEENVWGRYEICLFDDTKAAIIPFEAIMSDFETSAKALDALDHYPGADLLQREQTVFDQRKI